MFEKIYKYIDQKGLAAMVTIKRLAGVAPKVNRRNPLQAGKAAHKQGMQPALETHARYHHKSKTGVSVALQKGLMSSKNSFKRVREFIF